MGAMKTERPVSRKTKMPVTLCSLGSEENKKINYSKNPLRLILTYIYIFTGVNKCLENKIQLL